MPSYSDEMTNPNMYDETLKLLMQELKDELNPIIGYDGLEKDKELLDVYSELNKKQKDLAVSFENMLIRVYREAINLRSRDILGHIMSGYLYSAHPATYIIRWGLSSFSGPMGKPKYFGKNGYILNERKK